MQIVNYCIRGNLLLCRQNIAWSTSKPDLKTRISKRKRTLLSFFYSFLHSLFLSACSAKIDLALLIDGSSSVERYGVGNFRRIIDFVRGLTMGFAISRRNTRVSLIVYGTRPKTIFNFRRLVPSKIIS